MRQDHPVADPDAGDLATRPDAVRPAPAPVVELKPRAATPSKLPAPAPDPADEAVERDALAVARSVWLRGGRHRHAIFQGMSTMHADAVLARAVERQWVTVSEDGIVSPGTVNRAPVMPDTRSAKERAMAWGPGPGRDW